MSLDNPVVLVVDDEENLADLYSQWFTDEYEVRTAYDGEQALDLLDESVDVVLLDRQMPGLSGDDVLNCIRDEGLDCRVAMVTAVEPDFDIIELGFDDYLTKPVSKADLQEVIQGLLRRSTYDRRLQDYYSLVTTKVALEAEKSASVLADDHRYTDLKTEIQERKSELGRTQADLDVDDFEAAFRDLGQEASNK